MSHRYDRPVPGPVRDLIGDAGWGLRLHDTNPRAGPLPSLGKAADVCVGVVGDGVVTAGVRGERVRVTESAQSFDVERYDFGAFAGLWHERGQNWIVWDDDLGAFGITVGPVPQRTWTYAKFVLRHALISSVLGRPGHHCLHAVGASLPDGDVLLLAGPSGSGKTYLYEALRQRGTVTGWVEDDCAMVDDAGRILALIPAEGSVATATRHRVRAMVCLDQRAEAVSDVDVRAASRFAGQTPSCWPAPWLPGATRRQPEVDSLGRGVVCLRAPWRSGDDGRLLDRLAALSGG